MHRVFAERFSSAADLSATIAAALQFVNAREIIKPHARVFIKPNLTWRTPTPGVTVTPSFIRALVENLLPLTDEITIGESEGGQSCFLAEDAFKTHGLFDLQRDYGVRVVNLSKGEHEIATTTVKGREERIELPSMLLHDVDVFITLPVPKVHAMTGVSLGFKNQWGCLGDNMRVTQHPRFDRAVIAINKVLAPKLCIFDGTYFLDHTGPLMGQPVPMNMIIAGDDAGAASLVACEIMKVSPFSIGHHRVARAERMFPDSLEDVATNGDPRRFAERQFKLRRAFINYIHLAAFHTRPLNRLFYDSVFADGLHEALWFIRRQPVVKRLLYGKYGTGEANRGGRAV